MQAEEQNQLFARWFDSYRGMLFGIVNAFAFTFADRDDLFQEIATQIWQSIPGFRGDCSVKTWIYRIALNSAIFWSRQEHRHRQRKRALADHETVLATTDTVPDERLQWLNEQISRLNEIDRSVALLFLDGFSYQEMAEILGISESNVGVKIHRVKSRLARRWEEDHLGNT